VKSPDAVFSLLQKASENRRVCSTDMNDRSSRSHSIFQLALTGKNTITNEKVEGKETEELSYELKREWNKVIIYIFFFSFLLLYIIC
jgi:hypothetical protein